MKYYLAVGTMPEGPYTPAELLNHGLKLDSLVWAEGMPEWIQAGKIPELAELVFARDSGPCPPPLAGPVSGMAPTFPASSAGCGAAPQPQTRPQPVCPDPYYNGPCPKTWLVESILTTLLCCLPFGIVGIINASRVQSLWEQGFHDQALKASKAAGTWVAVAFFTGLALGIFYLLSFLWPLAILAF